MPPVTWTDPVAPRADPFWRWRRDQAKLRRAARAAAEGPHHGDPLREPGMAHLLAGLETTLVGVYRRDDELLGAQHLSRTSEWRLQAAAAAVAAASARHGTTAQAEISATSVDPADHARWEEALHARAQIQRAEDEHMAATEAHQHSLRLLTLALDRAVQRLGLVALAGRDRLEAYRTSYNHERDGMQRPGLGELPDGLVEDLITAATTRPGYMPAPAEIDRGEIS